MTKKSDDSIKIAMIGCDTSHCSAFARMLNDPGHPDYLGGASIVKAFPGGSSDFDLSADRVGPISRELRDKYLIQIVDTVEEAVESVDAILLESVDGRVHLEQFSICSLAGKPVFIDKPLAVSSHAASEIFRLSKERNVPVFSSSALRWTDGLNQAIAGDGLGAIYGADVCGPMEFRPPTPGYFWYGVHTVEMLYQVFGCGCNEVLVRSGDRDDLIVGMWSDGRMGSIRGNRRGHAAFSGVIHREKESLPFGKVSSQPKPSYHLLLQEVLKFFRNGESPVSVEEMLETIRFVEAANESRLSGQAVRI